MRTAPRSVRSFSEPDLSAEMLVELRAIRALLERLVQRNSADSAEFSGSEDPADVSVVAGLDVRGE